MSIGEARRDAAAQASRVEIFPQSVLGQAKEVQSLLREVDRNWPVALQPEADDPTKLDSSLDVFPNLFVDAFVGVSDSDLQIVALATRLLSTALLLGDRAMDGDSKGESLARNLLRAQAMNFEAQFTFCRALGADSGFWRSYRECLVQYAGACVEERRMVNREVPWTALTESAARELAVRKNSPIRIPVAALAHLADDNAPADALFNSLDAYSIGLQMFDDLRDWRSDLGRGFPSLLLVRALDGQEPESIDPRRLAKRIYYRGAAESVLDLGLQALGEAESHLEAWPDLPWRGCVQELRADIESMLLDLRSITQRNLHRVQSQPSVDWQPEPPRNGWHRLANQALQGVLGQWRLGYGELRHVMKSASRALKGENASDYQFADIFQRALVADILCDAWQYLPADLRPVLDWEANYLLDHRLPPPIGGWSYFPDLPEEPADSDDLGQVMQLLLRLGRLNDVETHAEPALDVLFGANAYPDGSFNTWILPEEKDTELLELQAECAELFGGDRQPEVVANLLYALHLYQPERFADEIHRGTRFVLDRQHADGSWPAFWYYGPYYGTYVALRLLRHVAAEEEAVDKARAFVLETRRDDGGWGFEDGSDPLSTALALCALAEVVKAGRHSPPAPVLDQALDYLRNVVGEAGTWDAVNFIAMPSLGHTAGYGSRTMTTAYVLKAAIAWQKLPGETGRPGA